jgi:hypothetical protein
MMLLEDNIYVLTCIDAASTFISSVSIGFLGLVAWLLCFMLLILSSIELITKFAKWFGITIEFWVFYSKEKEKIKLIIIRKPRGKQDTNHNPPWMILCVSSNYPIAVGMFPKPDDTDKSLTERCKKLLKEFDDARKEGKPTISAEDKKSLWELGKIILFYFLFYLRGRLVSSHRQNNNQVSDQNDHHEDQT